jgi:hypothetical protein
VPVYQFQCSVFCIVDCGLKEFQDILIFTTLCCKELYKSYNLHSVGCAPATALHSHQD